MIAKVLYSGNLRTEATHLASNQKIITDAPIDNHGKGEAFSPTDLVATSLASCMMTIMGIIADRNQINIDGTIAEVKKNMGENPRRISEIRIEFNFFNSISLEDRKKLERVAKSCPVSNSLSKNLSEILNFIYN
tara:strand:+ start:46 stop:447 length:402 start_codon:yes stop_codon:yes gene_type:complete